MYVCPAEFLKTYLKTAQNIRSGPGASSQVSGHCGENKLKGLAVRKPWVRAEFLGIIDFS